MAAGDYTVQLRAHGADPSSEPAFETGMLTIPGDVSITALATGLIDVFTQMELSRVGVDTSTYEWLGGHTASFVFIFAVVLGFWLIISLFRSKVR